MDIASPRLPNIGIAAEESVEPGGEAEAVDGRTSTPGTPPAHKREPPDLSDSAPIQPDTGAISRPSAEDADETEQRPLEADSAAEPATAEQQGLEPDALLQPVQRLLEAQAGGPGGPHLRLCCTNTLARQQRLMLSSLNGLCRCAGGAAEQMPTLEHQHSDDAIFTPAADQTASEAAANEANAISDAVWTRDEGADEFTAPGTSSHGISSVGWSESAGSDGSFGRAETPHEARLRGAVIAQLRVSAQHWSVSQVRTRNSWLFATCCSCDSTRQWGAVVSTQTGPPERHVILQLPLCTVQREVTVHGHFDMATLCCCQVCDWVEHLGLPYRKRFLHNLVDGRIALQLTNADMKVQTRLLTACFHTTSANTL